jgi:hypothetical protein
MKKFILSLFIVTSVVFTTKAQLLPSFQFGIKGGVNLASVSTSSSATFSSNNQAGYLGGVWARFGALGFNFQPEMYFASKSEKIGGVQAKFKSIDVPLLFGGKIGALGLGARFYTGPVVSFAIDKNNSFNGALGNATAFDYKSQNFAWQFGAGLDIKAISFDLRYEAGITKQTYSGSDARLNLFSLSLAYRLAKL